MISNGGIVLETLSHYVTSPLWYIVYYCQTNDMIQYPTPEFTTEIIFNKNMGHDLKIWGKFLTL